MDEWQKHQDEIRRERLYKKYYEICPKMYLHNDGKHPSINQSALAQVLGFKPGVKGLLLVGETGKGKTTAVWMLVRRLLCEEAVCVSAIRDPEFSREYSMRLGKGTADEWMDGLCRAQVVFIDDLGKAAVTPRYKEQLYDLIDSRIINQKPTIVTTQYNRTRLIERFGDEDGKALIRRFLEFCEVVNF